MFMTSRLETKFDVKGYYEKVKGSGKKIAWLTAFAPAELFLAFDIIPVYPENHAAMCGAVKKGNEPISSGMISKAIDSGFEDYQEGLCSYAMTDIGSVMSDEARALSPIGGLPEPDVLYACNSQCNVVSDWFGVYKQWYEKQGRKIPYMRLDTPDLKFKEGLNADELSYFYNQLRDHISRLEEISGMAYDEDRLKEILKLSDEAAKLWRRSLETCRNIPAPMTSFDSFVQMAPIVICRGTQEAVDYYKKLNAELDERVEKKISPVGEEKYRLLWDSIPVWPSLSSYAKFFAKHGACLVASTYTHVWHFEFDAERPLNTLVDNYSRNFTTRSLPYKTYFTMELIKDYKVDGVVFNRNWSCSIWNYLQRQRQEMISQKDIPTVIVQGDMVDKRYISDNVFNRLEAFIEILETNKEQKL